MPAAEKDHEPEGTRRVVPAARGTASPSRGQPCRAVHGQASVHARTLVTNGPNVRSDEPGLSRGARRGRGAARSMSCTSFGLATGGTQEWCAPSGSLLASPRRPLSPPPRSRPCAALPPPPWPERARAPPRRWRFSDAVGILVRVRDAAGSALPGELVQTTQVANLTVELDLEGRTRLREQEPPRRPDSALPDLSAPVPGEGSSSSSGELSAQTQALIRVLQNTFPSMIHAFSLFDADDGNEVGLMEVRSAVAWLHKRIRAEHPDDAQVLQSFDAKAFIRELSSSKLAGRGATLNLNDFVRKIRFGDTVENWKEKLEAAREWRNALLEDERYKENNFVRSLGTGFLDELKARLQEKFENAAEAFVFLDVACSGILTETQWKIGLRRLGVNINVRHLIMVLDGECGDGSTDEEEFTRLFAWHGLERWDKMMLGPQPLSPSHSHLCVPPCPRVCIAAWRPGLTCLLLTFAHLALNRLSPLPWQRQKRIERQRRTESLWNSSRKTRQNCDHFALPPLPCSINPTSASF